MHASKQNIRHIWPLEAFNGEEASVFCLEGGLGLEERMVDILYEKPCELKGFLDAIQLKALIFRSHVPGLPLSKKGQSSICQSLYFN